MRLSALICTVALALASHADAAYVSEAAINYTSRASMDYNDPPPFGPMYSLDPGQLNTGVDLRGSGFFHDAAIKFAIPMATSILSASLNLNTEVAYGNGGFAPEQLFGFATDSSQLTLADFTKASTSLGSFNVMTSNTVPDNYPVSIDVTSYVRSLLAGGSTAVGFRLENMSLLYGVLFTTPDDTTPAFRPSLTITYTAAVPEPASLALVVVGIAAAAAGRSARRRLLA